MNLVEKYEGCFNQASRNRNSWNIEITLDILSKEILIEVLQE